MSLLMGLEEEITMSHRSQMDRSRLNPTYLTSLQERIFALADKVSQEKRCSVDGD